MNDSWIREGTFYFICDTKNARTGHSAIVDKNKCQKKKLKAVLMAFQEKNLQLVIYRSCLNLSYVFYILY